LEKNHQFRNQLEKEDSKEIDCADPKEICLMIFDITKNIRIYGNFVKNNNNFHTQ
jgi:hypothetical protein